MFCFVLMVFLFVYLFFVCLVFWVVFFCGGGGGKFFVIFSPMIGTMNTENFLGVYF